MTKTYCDVCGKETEAHWLKEMKLLVLDCSLHVLHDVCRICVGDIDKCFDDLLKALKEKHGE